MVELGGFDFEIRTIEVNMDVYGFWVLFGRVGTCTTAFVRAESNLHSASLLLWMWMWRRTPDPTNVRVGVGCGLGSEKRGRLGFLRLSSSRIT